MPSSRSPNQDTINTIVLGRNVALYVGEVALLLRRIADALLIVTFVELGNGFMYALSKKRDTYQTALRWTAISTSIVLIIIAIACMGMAMAKYPDYWAVTDIWEYDRDESPDFEAITEAAAPLRNLGLLSASYDILNWVISILIIVYASIVMHFYAVVEPSRCVGVLPVPWAFVSS